MPAPAEPLVVTGVLPVRPAHPERVVRRRHPGRWIAYFIIAAGALLALESVVTNQNFGWDVVAEYFFSPRLLSGLVNTLWLTVVAMALGAVLGIVLAIMRMSDSAVIAGIASAYIWFFRGTPVFVQLLFWGYISALYPSIVLGLPGLAPLAEVETNHVITPIVAAILGLGLNEGAYMAEIVRAGIGAVPRGQLEAASALGMSRGLTLRRIILPQAMRVIVPPTANEVISMLKTTSLVSVLAFPELLYASQLIYSENFKTIPLLITASIWYLIVTTLLTGAQYVIERRFARADHAVRNAGGVR